MAISTEVTPKGGLVRESYYPKMALKINCPDICMYIYVYIHPEREHVSQKATIFKKEVSFEPWTDHHFVRYFSFQGGICYNQSVSLLKKIGVAQTKIATANFLTPKKFLTPKFPDPKRDPTFPLRTQKNQGCQICPLHISGNMSPTDGTKPDLNSILSGRWLWFRAKPTTPQGVKSCQKSSHHLTLLMAPLVNRVPWPCGRKKTIGFPLFLRPAMKKPVFLRG